jgi:hypothetical protein
LAQVEDIVTKWRRRAIVIGVLAVANLTGFWFSLTVRAAYVNALDSCYGAPSPWLARATAVLGVLMWPTEYATDKLASAVPEIHDVNTWHIAALASSMLWATCLYAALVLIYSAQRRWRARCLVGVDG